MRQWGLATAELTGCLPTYDAAGRETWLVKSIPVTMNLNIQMMRTLEINVDKYDIRNSADVMSDCSEGNSPLSYLDLQCWQATNILVSVWEISKHRQVRPLKIQKYGNVMNCPENQ